MYQREVTFGEAVTMALSQNYCNFQGRSSRSEYWWFTLFTTIVSLAITLIFGQGIVGGIISGLVTIVFLLPELGLFVRRMHDTGRSGWWILLCLIPLVGAIILIVWLCQPSDNHPNEYGPVPNVVEAR